MLPVGATILSNVLYIQTCLLNTYCMKGPVTGARDTVMSKTESLPHETYIPVGKSETHTSI